MQPSGGESHGVVAVGDSWLSGYGLALAGVSCTSWAAWLSWALNVCCTQHAVNGATAEQAARDQVPLLRGRYRLGVAWLGANDLSRFDPSRYGASLTTVCTALLASCDVVAVGTLPASVRVPDMGWRGVGAVRQRANIIIRQVVGETSCLLVELEDELTGPWSMAPDRQHPTSVGQLEVAAVAAQRLDAVGVRFLRHLPDVAALHVSDIERELYDARLAARARGAWGSIKHWRADRGVTRAMSP
jgi:hypothetical protein